MPQSDEEQKYVNSYMNRLLAYVQNDEYFVEFIKGLESYVCSASGPLEYSIDSHNPPVVSGSLQTGTINSSSDFVYLQRLVNLLGIPLDYFPANYTSAPSDEQRQRLKELFVIALNGAVINRFGNATKAQLLESLQSMYPSAQIEILDGGDPNTDISLMNIRVNIKGFSATMDEAVLSLYLRQNITGVQEEFNFDVSGTGIFSPVDTSISTGTAITTDLDIQTNFQIIQYFEANPTEVYGYSSENPTGTGGYMWCMIERNGTGHNNFRDTPTTQSTMYLSTAYWMISLI